ncbi:FERM domain-containing protein 6-like [Patiria miniata]|uniref:FERM domain-containing protein n=1 Tax=Patiria miniata TaxID=46514 RepID=A0A914BEQ6_PATMI|nr:FERM domain-containing protein 6-like [Patiria miniata]XP_038074356.1 FERM domain-containing protein 6-like [Patiria miniata]
MPSKTGSGTTLSSNPGRKYVNIILLNEEEVPLVVEPKTKVQDIFDQVCLLVGVKETQFFWLSVLRDGEQEFLDQKSKISKYAPKGWKTESPKVTDKSGRPIFNVYFRVQLYVEHVSLIKEDITRQNYYLQLKQNVLSAPVLCHEDATFILASYALQADLGNYAEDTHRLQYFEPRKYFPEWVIKRRGEAYILKHVPAMHRDQRATTRVNAQRAYIREASNTIEHVMHFYRLKKTKTELTPSIWLGISTRGIQLYEDSGEGKYLLCEYTWGIIKRLVLQKKKFELHVEGADGRKITYYTHSEAKSKHLLRLCKLTHTFQMQTQPMVDTAKKRESAAEKSKYRESYISGDTSWSDLDSSMTTTSFGEISTAKLELQRQSVVSNVSSVTTSGIVSDERSPLEKSLSEVEDEFLFNPSNPHDSALGSSASQPLGLAESHHSSLSSGLGERGQAINKQHGGQLSNRCSAAVSETSSHRSGPEPTPAFVGVWSDQQPTEAPRSSSSAGHSNRQSRNSELGWLSDDEAKREASSQSSGSRPTSRHLTLIDTQMIQAEIASKDVPTPLLSALCNDRSLLMMQQQQMMQGDEDEDEDDDDETTTQDQSRFGDLESCRTPSSQSSMHEVRASQDLNMSVTTLVSHSSIDSDMHGSIVEHHHANSSSLVASPVREDYSSGLLTKHQTLNTLNDLTDPRRYDSRLPFGEGGSDGRIKCQTLPIKMNASEQMLKMGRDPVIKEECVSLSAPNLSPGADQNEIPILLS